jgi:hypothetical protein
MTSDYSNNKKKATTSVIGMDTEPDMKLKDVAKAFLKKFAVSIAVSRIYPMGRRKLFYSTGRSYGRSCHHGDRTIQGESRGCRWRFRALNAALKINKLTYEDLILHKIAIILFFLYRLKL